jgi:hypothetical protein
VPSSVLYPAALLFYAVNSSYRPNTRPSFYAVNSVNRQPPPLPSLLLSFFWQNPCPSFSPLFFWPVSRARFFPAAAQRVSATHCRQSALKEIIVHAHRRTTPLFVFYSDSVFITPHNPMRLPFRLLIWPGAFRCTLAYTRGHK